jgi:ABC-2 type transport system ATP-binding protein
MNPAVSIRGLRVVRGGREVLHAIDLDVAPGSVTGLLGPSGSGKTTLLRSIVGTQIVEAGTVTVLGLSAGSRALRSRVGYMTQAVSVYDDLTIDENLAYFGRIVGVDEVRIDRVLERVGLSSHMDQVVRTLSGGEQARVSLGAALLNEPDVLVLDEPTVGLDPLLRRDLWAFFHELAAGGTTLLVSSHVMDEAARCDSLVLLREGSILAQATPDEVLRRTGQKDLVEAFLELVERGRE